MLTAHRIDIEKRLAGNSINESEEMMRDSHLEMRVFHSVEVFVRQRTLGRANPLHYALKQTGRAHSKLVQSIPGTTSRDWVIFQLQPINSGETLHPYDSIKDFHVMEQNLSSSKAFTFYLLVDDPHSPIILVPTWVFVKNSVNFESSVTSTLDLNKVASQLEKAGPGI